MQEREYKITLTEENKSKVEQFLKLLNIDVDIIEAESLKEQSKEKWPQNGDYYFYLDSVGSLYGVTYISDDIIDNKRIEIGNCFKTKEEAEFELERLKVIAKMKKFVEPEDREWGGRN